MNHKFRKDQVGTIVEVRTDGWSYVGTVAAVYTNNRMAVDYNGQRVLFKSSGAACRTKTQNVNALIIIHRAPETVMAAVESWNATWARYEARRQANG